MSEINRRLKDVLSSFENQNLERFYRENLGEYSLVQFKIQLIDIQKKLKLILENDIIKDLADKNASDLMASITNIGRIVMDVILTHDNDSFLDIRKDTIVKMEAAIDVFKLIWLRVSPLIIEKKFENLNSESFVEEAKIRNERTREFESEIEKSVEVVTEIKNTLESKISAIENRYQDVVEKFELASGTMMFENLASKNLKKANRWLYPAGIFFGILLVLLYFFWLNICKNHLCILDQGLCQFCKLKSIGVEYTQSLFIFELIKVWAFKVFCVSLLLYIIVFCLKQYQIEMHNYTLNSHKAGALNSSTFLLEVIGKTIRQDNESAKEQIIKTAAEAIFSHQKTGYNSKDKEPDLNMFMNLLKSMK